MHYTTLSFTTKTFHLTNYLQHCMYSHFQPLLKWIEDLYSASLYLLGWYF